MASITPKRGSLGLIIGRFKGAVTQYANNNHIPFKWQPRFYDSIIFDQDGFERVWHYIENNVNNWEKSGRVSRHAPTNLIKHNSNHGRG